MSAVRTRSAGRKPAPTRPRAVPSVLSLPFRFVRLIVRLLARRPVVGTFLLALGLVSLASTLAPTGSWGGAWWHLLRQAFGWGAPGAAVVTSTVGLAVLQPARLHALLPYRRQLTAIAALLVALLGLAGLASPAAGGALGILIAWPVDAILGTTLAVVAFGLVALGAVFGALEAGPAELAAAAAALASVTRGLLARRPLPIALDDEPEAVLVEAPAAEPPAEAAARPSRKPAARPPKPPEPAPPLQPSGLLPPVDLLEATSEVETNDKDVRRKAQLLEETLAHFGVPTRVVEWNQGPTFTQFGVEPGFDVKSRDVRDREGRLLRSEEISRTKVKVARITTLANDLALALSAPTIRIEAPVPGKSVVGIEVPNSTSSVVSLRSVVESANFQKLRSRTRLGVALGKDVEGRAVVADLAKMPHLLIAGSTGSGKSVAINALITCLLMHCSPEELRLLMVDPKRVEMTGYDGVPHLLAPVVVDLERVVGVLKVVVQEMQTRYTRFAELGVRNIDGYNRKLPESEPPLAYWVVIIDELADLMMVAPDDVERLICRLAQMARATGIHLVIATQRPSVDVVTGLIKANFPTRIAFAVTSQIDSRTILDTPGAEKLLGRGDMLFLPTDAPKPHRLQGVYVSDDEIGRVVEFWKDTCPTQYLEAFLEVEGGEDEDDPLVEEARRLLGDRGSISVSELQRRLRVGYNRAARIKELLAEEGLIDESESKWG